MFGNVDRVWINRVWIYNCYGDGIVMNPNTLGYSASSQDVWLTNVSVEGCGSDGFAGKGMTNLHIINSVFHNNGDRVSGSGITLVRNTTVPTHDNYDCEFENCIFDNPPEVRSSLTRRTPNKLCQLFVH